MTEKEWLNASEPSLLFALIPPTHERKLRLFTCGCVRHIESLLWAGEASSQAVSIAEDFSDGIRPPSDLSPAQANVASRLGMYPGEPIFDAAYWTCEAKIGVAVEKTSFYAAIISTRRGDRGNPRTRIGAPS